MTNEIIINDKEKENYQTVNEIDKVDDFLLIKLNDDSCFLTNGVKTIKLKSGYYYLKNVVDYGDVCYGLNESYIININTGEVLLADSSIYMISKEDDETLRVYRHEKPTTLFSLITKSYLKVPDNYEIEQNLDNYLYSFCEKNYDKEFHDLDRIIINSAGKTIFENVEKGHIQNYKNNIIICNDNEITIMKVVDENAKIIKAPKNDKTEYYNGNIYLIEKNQIKVLDLDLNVVKNIAVPNLDAVKYWEVNGGIIKLELPDTINGEEIERAIFVNITNELVMQHRRIIAIPYSTPDFYIGFDNLEPSEYKKLGVEPPKEKNTYYFYDSDFNKILEVKADDYADLNKGKVLLFDRTQDGWKTKFVNLHECIVKDCPYDDIHFNAETQIGHGYNENTDMIDIFDKNLNLLFTNIDYKKYNIDRNRMNITYRVVNNNIIFQIQRGGYVLRNIIFDENNNILFDSTNHDCKLIGNLIEIRRFNDFEGDSTYLNTLTGDIGTLHVSQSDGALKLVMNGQKSILSSSELFLKDGN